MATIIISHGTQRFSGGSIHLGEVSIEWATRELKGFVPLTSVPFDICPSRSIARAFLDDGRGLVGGDFCNHRWSIGRCSAVDCYTSNWRVVDRCRVIQRLVSSQCNTWPTSTQRNHIFFGFDWRLCKSKLHFSVGGVVRCELTIMVMEEEVARWFLWDKPMKSGPAASSWFRSWCIIYCWEWERSIDVDGDVDGGLSCSCSWSCRSFIINASNNNNNNEGRAVTCSSKPLFLSPHFSMNWREPRQERNGALSWSDPNSAMTKSRPKTNWASSPQTYAAVMRTRRLHLPYPLTLRRNWNYRMLR